MVTWCYLCTHDGGSQRDERGNPWGHGYRPAAKLVFSLLVRCSSKVEVLHELQCGRLVPAVWPAPLPTDADPACMTAVQPTVCLSNDLCNVSRKVAVQSRARFRLNVASTVCVDFRLKALEDVCCIILTDCMHGKRWDC